MSGSTHPKLANVDMPKSYILGVIYDDVSLTLEMDFHVTEGHPRYVATDDPEGCYVKGIITFKDMDDLRLKKAKVAEGEERNLSIIETAEIDGDYCYILSGWGEIELTAKTIQVLFD
ncbi:hypothetical protein [Aurantiacibacter gangjinensis]|uniref:Uncharacterized protein n=1 Tax=Aurantiacibacter gangjinensis TaxID=502682 RepID=A0A0G9MPX3_9SPHN|nr:hypothetical protein [Aurantiacibacter gangjinensis]APE28593.1 hypothetical protein BMF35_a1764 [Aurantiacibacter gangjinensis]KLE32781.1 hypothetical protein AAW01_01710 [Aurantiacibacter gangjinensis]